MPSFFFNCFFSFSERKKGKGTPSALFFQASIPLSWLVMARKSSMVVTGGLEKRVRGRLGVFLKAEKKTDRGILCCCFFTKTQSASRTTLSHG